MTAPVRSPTVPLMVPPSGSAGEGSWAVAFGAPEGCGDCARAGKEQSGRTQNKRKLGHTQGRLPLPKTNLRRVRPRDFPEESFLAEFAIAPFFTVRPYLAPDKALTRQRGPKFQSYDCCWMTLAGYGLDGRKQTGLPRYALRQARLGRTGAPGTQDGARVTPREGGSAQRTTRRRSTAHRSGSRCAPPFQGLLRLCICGNFRSKSFRPR